MGDWIWALIPICALLIPIVAILTAHQQKMAQILHRGAADHDEIANLRKELAEMRSLVHQQTITLDNIAGVQSALAAPPPAPEIKDRLNTGA
jgi:hypothetical protein